MRSLNIEQVKGGGGVLKKNTKKKKKKPASYGEFQIGNPYEPDHQPLPDSKTAAATTIISEQCVRVRVCVRVQGASSGGEGARRWRARLLELQAHTRAGPPRSAYQGGELGSRVRLT